jgi:C-terminal processing protease CtpA/Prc
VSSGFAHQRASMSDQAGIGLGLGAQGDSIVVRSMALGGPAALSGCIAVGDVIISVAGQAVGGDREKAAALIAGANGSTVQLAIRDDKKVAATVTLARQEPIVAQPASAPTEAGIGLKIERQTDDSVVRIVSVAPGGAADVGGKLQKGDVLMSVDGTDVSGMPCKAIAPLLAGAPGSRVRIGVRRDAATLEVAIVRNPVLDAAAVNKIGAYKEAVAKAAAGPAAASPKKEAAAPKKEEAKGEAAAAAPADGSEGGEKKKKTKGELKAEAYAAKCVTPPSPSPAKGVGSLESPRIHARDPLKRGSIL